MTGHQQYTHQRAASLINKKQIKNEWHCFQTSCQESHNKLKRLNQTTLSCSVFFFLADKKNFKASPEELLSIIIWGKATGWRGQRKLPGNSQRIVCSPGWGYNMYIHKAKLLMPDCQDKVCFHTHQKTPSGGFLWCHLRSFSRRA